MSKPWFAFFKRAAACTGVSAFLALLVALGSVAAGFAADPVLPERTVVLSTRGGQVLRVGDTVAYAIEGGDAAAEARWALDPKSSGLKLGFLFRPGRLFTPLAAGELSLPSLPILDGQDVVVAKSRPLVISIASNLSESERAGGEPPKPEAALGPMGLPFPAWIQSAIALTILGAVVILAFVVLRYLRRKAAAALKKILPKKPYDLAALERIEGLTKAGYLERKTFKPFYFGLSETLKFYLGERFEFDAQESTTSELISLLKEKTGAPGLNEALIRRVQALFESLDPVKFADQIPSVGEAQAVQNETREIILASRKVAADPILKPAPKGAP